MPKARIAGVFYLITFVTGASALLATGRLAFAASLIAATSYVAVTFLFYGLFKPVNRNLSLLAALVSLAGCAVSALRLLYPASFDINPLVFFGCYCLLIGYLIFRSTFLPRALGALMAFGGVGWLTFASPALAHSLYPYDLIPGVLGEGVLTLWLLAFGVNLSRWQARADAATAPALRAHR